MTIFGDLSIETADVVTDDDDSETCVYCSHAIIWHGRSGCHECSCISEPAPYDPSDD